MSDHPEHPAPDELRPTPQVTEDFPADFFDDVADPSPLAPNPMPAYDDWGVDPSPIAEPGPLVDRHEESVEVDEPAHVIEPRSQPVAKHYASLPVAEAPPGAPAFPIVMGILMVGAIVAAVLVSKNESPATAAPAAAAPATTPEAPTSAPSDTITSEVKDLKGQLEALGVQLKGLMAKVDGLPKPPEPVDLAPVQGKIEELSKNVGTVVALTDKVGKLDERLGGIDGTIKAVNEKVAALSDELKKAAEAPKSASALTTAEHVKPDVDKTAAGLTEGAELFKAGKYKEASEVFKKLEAADAKDARVYYYAALSNGLSTSVWKDETMKLAAKGAELEKAGMTKPEDVDATFTDLPVTLKPWLTFFRKAAK